MRSGVSVAMRASPATTSARRIRLVQEKATPRLSRTRWTRRRSTPRIRRTRKAWEACLLASTTSGRPLTSRTAAYSRSSSSR